MSLWFIIIDVTFLCWMGFLLTSGHNPGGSELLYEYTLLYRNSGDLNSKQLHLLLLPIGILCIVFFEFFRIIIMTPSEFTIDRRFCI